MATNPDEERKKATAPRLGTSMPGNPARAQAMQAQYNQPVFRGGSGLTPAEMNYTPSAGEILPAGTHAELTEGNRRLMRGYYPGAYPDQQRKPAQQQAVAAQPVPGNPVRAGAMQAQFKQPVYKGYGPAGAPERPPAPVASKPEPQAPQQQLGMTLTPEQVKASTKKAQLERSRKQQAEFKAGVGNTLDRLGNSAMNVANMPGRTIIEGAKQIGAFVGNTRFDNSLPDYDNKGLEQRKAANWAKNNPAEADAARVGMRAVADRASSAAIGQVQAAQPASAPGMGDTSTPAVNLNAPAPAAPAAPAATAPVTSDAGPQGQPDGGYQRTSVEGVVGRVGANGVPEFSNAPGDVSSSSDNQMTAGRMGNGVGMLSVGAAGDSALAMERFGRASEIRAGTNQLRRQGTLGDNGNFTIVKDSGRTPNIGEVVNERLGMSRQRLENETANSQADRSLRERDLEARVGFKNRELGNQERELSNAEQTGALERQRLGMELETGQLSLEQQRQIQQLREQLADPNLDPATREQIQRTYNALTIPAKDRYVLQDTVMGYDTLGAPIMGKAALDVTNGQMVGQNQQPAAQQPPQAGTVRNGYRFKGGDPKDQKNWEQI